MIGPRSLSITIAPDRALQSCHWHRHRLQLQTHTTLLWNAVLYIFRAGSKYLLDCTRYTVESSYGMPLLTLISL